MTWIPTPIRFDVQEAHCDLAMEKRGINHQEADKQNRKKTIVVVEGKKKGPHAPITDVLRVMTELGERLVRYCGLPQILQLWHGENRGWMWINHPSNLPKKLKYCPKAHRGSH